MKTLKIGSIAIAAVLIISAEFPCAKTHAALLVSKEIGGDFSYGYSGSQWTVFSSALGVACNGNIQITTNLNDIAQVMAADALWIDTRNDGFLLSAIEVQNIQSFIATGKRVVLMGENDNWTTWNNQITGLVGGSYGGEFNRNSLTIHTHELTDSVAELEVVWGGIALSGTPLVSPAVASLYGPANNVLVVLDVNMFDDSYGHLMDNAAFAQNVADWIAVPADDIQAVITQCHQIDSGFRLEWIPVPGMNSVIKCSTDLVYMPFTDLSVALPYPVNSYTDTVSNGKCFYRVDLQP